MRNNRVLLMLLLIFSMVLQAVALTNNSRIETAADLEYWCQQKVEQHFRRHKQRVYNWSSRTLRQFNDLHTTAFFLAGKHKRQAQCRIRIGRKAKSMKLTIEKK